MSGDRLAATGVTVRFGGLTALSRVDLAVAPATVVGLVGPNGAGKSTMFGVLSGLIRPAEGQIVMDGKDITGASPQARAALGLARTFQQPQLFSRLTVRENLVLADRVRHCRRRVWADMFTAGALRRPGLGEDKRVDRILALLGLAPLAHRQAAGLPLGVSRLVELGRALAASPAVLLLDEPSSGLDSQETGQLEASLLRTVEHDGVSVLLVEHDVDMVLRMSTRVHVLDFGVQIAAGPPGEIRVDPSVRAAYLGAHIDAEGSATA
jgi:ABC-type branched-subunit amino acid transport system ATPase component